MGFSLGKIGSAMTLGLLDEDAFGPREAGQATTTAQSSIPAWQLPFVLSGLRRAQRVYGNTAVGTPLLRPASDEMMRTIQGAYLSPESNPYLQGTFDTAAKQVSDVYRNVVQPRTDSMFFGPGSMGGNSAYQETVARNNYGFGQNLTELANQIYGGNYQQERGRQFAATGAAPGFTSAGFQSRMAPHQAYMDIVGKPFGQTQTQTQPYFQNDLATLGGLLSGGAGLFMGMKGS